MHGWLHREQCRDVKTRDYRKLSIILSNLKPACATFFHQQQKKKKKEKKFHAISCMWTGRKTDKAQKENKISSHGRIQELLACRSLSIWLQPQRHVLTVVFVFLVACCPREIFSHFIASNKFNLIFPKLHDKHTYSSPHRSIIHADPSLSLWVVKSQKASVDDQLWLQLIDPKPPNSLCCRLTKQTLLNLIYAMVTGTIHGGE